MVLIDNSESNPLTPSPTLISPQELMILLLGESV